MKGFNLRRSGDVKRIVETALAYNEGPCLINCEVEKTDNVYPMVPAGAALEAMLVEAPTKRMRSHRVYIGRVEDERDKEIHTVSVYVE